MTEILVFYSPRDNIPRDVMLEIRSGDVASLVFVDSFQQQSSAILRDAPFPRKRVPIKNVGDEIQYESRVRGLKGIHAMSFCLKLSPVSPGLPGGVTPNLSQ